MCISHPLMESPPPLCGLLIFFFKQKTAYEVRISDWSSDVCSSELKTSASGAKAAATTNKGTVHGFISASGRYSGSSTVPYLVRLWCRLWMPSYMKDGISSGTPIRDRKSVV